LPARVRILRWLRHFWPAPLDIDGRERLRFIVGAVLGVFLTAVLSRWWAGGGHAHGPWMLGSLGASAILVFGMPSSPLAQPWPVLGGSTLSAMVGAVCAALVPDPALAGALVKAAAASRPAWARSFRTLCRWPGWGSTPWTWCPCSRRAGTTTSPSSTGAGTW
jgi:CBS domain-containing membrane protein